MNWDFRKAAIFLCTSDCILKKIMLNRHIKKKKKHLNFFSILNMASKHAQFILPHFIILRDFTGPLKGHSSVNELSHKLNESTFQSFLAFCNDKQCFVCLEIIKASIFPLFPFHFSQTQKKDHATKHAEVRLQS